jgi:hypothetical protein
MDTLYSREAAEEARSRNIAGARAEEKRLCSTCHWYKKGTLGHMSDVCTYPLMPYIVKENVLCQIIRGESVTTSMLCATARTYDNECGADARYWEAAP